MKILAAMLTCAVLPQAAGGDAFAAALADYRAQRYEAALAGFTAELQAAGEGASPELRCDAALAALRMRRPGDAEAAARPLLEHNAADERAWGEFLLGQAAMQRAEVAAAAARLPDAEPMAWQAAVSSAERAFAHWCRAAQRPGGWHEAQRNAERALHALDELRRQRDAAQPTKKKDDAPPPPAPTDQQPLEEQLPDLTVPPLSPAQLQELAQKLARKEKEKRTTRIAAQRGQAVAGERDW
ncbi:MAG: hypothetical protein H6838_06800 [Planctomycetes bacterium]|nr:hypothetical protein [Planctomycetota bacterium]